MTAVPRLPPLLWFLQNRKRSSLAPSSTSLRAVGGRGSLAAGDARAVQRDVQRAGARRGRQRWGSSGAHRTHSTMSSCQVTFSPMSGARLVWACGAVRGAVGEGRGA